MRETILLTLTGPDRVGIVEDVTKLLLDAGGNVETSRMARLGGEFAILLLASLPGGHQGQLESAIAQLTGQGYKVTVGAARKVETAVPSVHFRIELVGADNEGIVHEVARYLSQRGINIESMETAVSHGAMSGTPLFSMNASVAVPLERVGDEWQNGLQAVAADLNVEITVVTE